MVNNQIDGAMVKGVAPSLFKVSAAPRSNERSGTATCTHPRLSGEAAIEHGLRQAKLAHVKPP